MATTPFDYKQLMSMTRIDLGNFSEGRLSDAGELQIPSDFEKPFYVVVGSLALEHDVLEVSRIVEAQSDDRHDIDGLAGYLLKNVTSGSGTASILFGNNLSHVTTDDERFTLYQGEVLVIGRDKDATPALELSSEADGKHAELRVGNIQGNLHIIDLYSRNGTTAYLDPIDADSLRHYPTQRTWSRVDDDPNGLGWRLTTAVERRWLYRRT